MEQSQDCILENIRTNMEAGCCQQGELYISTFMLYASLQALNMYMYVEH